MAGIVNAERETHGNDPKYGNYTINKFEEIFKLLENEKASFTIRECFFQDLASSHDHENLLLFEGQSSTYFTDTIFSSYGCRSNYDFMAATF